MSKAKRPVRKTQRTPVGRKRGEQVTKEGGPYRWFFEQMEAAYSRILPKGEAAPRKRAAAKRKKSLFASKYQPGLSDEVLQPVEMDFWVKRLQQYKERKVEAIRKIKNLQENIFPSPAVPGTNNWVPIGPSVVARGQASGRPAIGGRISGLAIANGGTILFAASANGGVWRSDDSGASWRSMMDNFDNNPTSFASTSLCMGAIAIDPGNTNRIYAGTGEGATNALFTSRLINALPSYRGIGPIRSDDGGLNWIVENTAAASPTLAGQAFFALAVDPANIEHVVAATTNGIYQRVAAGGGGFEWVQRRTGNFSSVVVANAGGVTTFFAAQWGTGVFSSANGQNWATLGTGFPTSGVSRISLAVQRDNPNVLYAFVADTSSNLKGVYRLDGMAGAWTQVSGIPAVLNGSGSGGQGNYDLAIAIDPNNTNRFYLGGDTQLAGGQWSSTITRIDVTAAGGTYSGAGTYIGANVHGDTHVLALPPGNSNVLWGGGDGGLFVNANPAGGGTFQSRNVGLACLCANYIGMSAQEPALLFCGFQDNGTGRYTGEESWRHVSSGDGGYCVVNWNDRSQILVYANGRFYRATDGGQDYGSWTSNVFPWLVMAEPMVGTPLNPANPAEANIISVGTGTTLRFSTDFGATFPTTLTLPGGSGVIYSMVFARADRLYVGTSTGQVFRVDNSGGWAATRIDNAAGGALPLTGLVSDIAIDWADAARGSIYIALGGTGDYRHVWHFDNTQWQARSGPAAGPNNLLDVEHNAIVVDPSNTATVYVGADVGVWISTDSGNNWTAMSNGLPDAPVFDLQIHQGARLLRASTHGRGMFEFKLDPPVQADRELYLRDTMLDTGRGENTDGRNDPSVWPTGAVRHWLSPNIKVDVPTPAGYQTATNQIDFLQFNEVIIDGSQGVGTNVPPPAVHNRVYVEVHNRGPLEIASVNVTAAVTNASTVLNPLPAGYTAAIQSGTNLPGPDWTTLGIVPLTNLRPGFPQIAAFDLPSTILPPPASLPGQSHWCLLAFAHSAQDSFTNGQTNVDLLTLGERKVAQKNLHIVEFVGTPPPSASMGAWAMIEVRGLNIESARNFELVADLRKFPGRVGFLFPGKLFRQIDTAEQSGLKKDNSKRVMEWKRKHAKDLERLHWEAKFSKASIERMQKAMKATDDVPLLVSQKENGLVRFPKLKMGANEVFQIFLWIERPREGKIGQQWFFDFVQLESSKNQVVGGSTYKVVINRQK